MIALRDNIESINADTLNNALKELKSKFPNEKILQEFSFDANSEETQKIVEDLKKSASK